MKTNEEKLKIVETAILSTEEDAFRGPYFMRQNVQVLKALYELKDKLTAQPKRVSTK